MSTPDSELDRQLQALFAGLDTRADFESRLMTRLGAESHTDAIERAVRARRQERARYKRAVLELQGWRRSTLRLLTLDTLGIALLLVAAVVTAWPWLSRDLMRDSRQYGSYMMLLLSILIGAVPLLGMWAQRTRQSVRS